MRKAITTCIALYVVVISIIGICDTVNNAVEKRAQAQEVLTERLERNQARLQEQVMRRQQKLDDNMNRR